MPTYRSCSLKTEWLKIASKRPLGGSPKTPAVFKTLARAYAHGPAPMLNDTQTRQK